MLHEAGPPVVKAALLKRCLSFSLWIKARTASHKSCSPSLMCSYTLSISLGSVTLFAPGDVQVLTVVAAQEPDRRSPQRDELSSMLTTEGGKVALLIEL